MKTKLFSLFSLLFTLYSFAGVGVTKKQLDRTVSEINSNMSAAVSAEIGRNIDGHIERIGREAAMAATNYLPSFIAGLGEFADASRFALTDFTTNSLAFNDTFISNGVFVAIPRTAYFSASFVSPTNKGFVVASSSVPNIPEGTMFYVAETPDAYGEDFGLVDNATGAPVNNPGKKKNIFFWKWTLHNADLISKPLDFLQIEDRGNKTRVIAESGRYDAGFRIEWQTAAQTSKAAYIRRTDSSVPNWVSPPAYGNENYHIETLTCDGGVFRMAVMDDDEPYRIIGTFTLVPACLTDAQAYTARYGSPKLSAFDRVLRFMRNLFAAPVVAGRHHEIFAGDSGLPTFQITWTSSSGEVLGKSEIPVSKTPPKKKVDDLGREHSTDRFYSPGRWYTLADWCTVENWIAFPTEYSIYYEDALGKYESESGIRYSISTRKLNVATFKALFLGYAESLESLYIFPEEVERRDPCREGRHSYIHCVCSICGHTREHNYIQTANGCFRCVNEESAVYVTDDNEIAVDPDSTSVCGHVPDGVDYHSGWRHVGEADSNGYGEYCGCACGHYSDNNNSYYPAVGYSGIRRVGALSHLMLVHDFDTDTADASWESGDEHGHNSETVHHAELPCQRDCGARRFVVENHNYYKADGTYSCTVNGIGEENYHEVVGECLKCLYQEITQDLHRRQMPDEGHSEDSCLCIGGVHFDTEGCGEFHHRFETTACGEVRCIYCLKYHDSSPRLADSEHWGVQDSHVQSGDIIGLAGMKYSADDQDNKVGVVLRARKSGKDGHWCGCGLVQLPHRAVEDPDSGMSTCPRVCPPGMEEYWWAYEGCGWVHDTPDKDKGEFDLEYKESYRNGYNERSLKTKNGNSWFSWIPGRGEQPPTPDQLWADSDSYRRPSTLPDEVTRYTPFDYVLTSLDFTYQMPDSPVTFTTSYEWDGQKWVLKKFPGWWDSDLWRAIKNSPLFPMP